MAGFEKAREWLRDGRAGLVVQAADGSPEERARFLSGARGAVAVHAPLSAAALGAVFGRDRVVHVVLAPGVLAERIGRDCTRLAGLASGVAANDKAANDKAANDKARHDKAGNGKTANDKVDPADLRQRGVRDE